MVLINFQVWMYIRLLLKIMLEAIRNLQKNMEIYNMQYTVKDLSVSDVPILTALFKYKDINEMIAENARDIENGVIDIFALFDRDKIIGELRVKYFSDDNRFAEKGKRAYLYAFRIHKKYQGKGLGNFLLENVLTILTENGYSEFTVGVEDENSRARYMYEKHGFIESVARIKESYQGDNYEYDLLLKKEDVYV